MSFLTPVWSYVDALVHPAAQQDALTSARHRLFIAPRLLGSSIAIASLPFYIAIRGVPTALEVGIFSWFAIPILIAYYLSLHILSSLSVVGLVIPVAIWTGGITSFAAIWLALVPLEAAFSASRRLVTLATIFALVAAGILIMLSAVGMLPQTVIESGHYSALVVFAIILATLYGACLSFGVELLVRTSQSSLHAQENRYRLLAANTTDVIVHHARNGSVLPVSPSAEMLVGGPANALLGNGLFDRVHVADRPAYLTALADAASENEERLVEFRLRRDVQAEHAIQFLWVEMRCRPRGLVLGKRNQAGCEVVAALRDISDRKSQSRAIEIALSESEQANAAKSRFIATMGHELRTPLNAIIGFSDMLKNESLKLDAERQSEYARLINDSGRHLLSVVDGILDASRMNTGNLEIRPESFAPAPAIESCANLLALKAREAGIEIQLDVSSDLPDVVADRRAFNQILINLIANAIKFTPREGQVVVTALRERSKLAVTIEDNGIGIDETDLPHLGEPFFQASSASERRHDGTGLGLSIVKSLVHLHRGDVVIQSRLGEGTRVTVRLPFEGGSRGKVSDFIKLVPERGRGIAMTANTQVKKSA